GIENVANSFTPDPHASGPVQPYEVGEYQDLARRASDHHQADSLRIHHAPQKAIADDVIPGYPAAPAPTGPAIAIPIDEHTAITRAQASYSIGRFSGTPSPERLITRDFFQLRQYTQAPVSALRNLAAMIRGRFPSLRRW